MTKKVLTVDDSRAVRMMVKKALSSLDIDILEAANGKEGLDIALNESPDLILLDYNMPEMTGEEMLKSLRAENSDTPVVMLTTEGMQQTIEGLNALGLSGYITKPFKAPALWGQVKTLLGL